MNNILSLINPARIIKVEDAMKVAQIEMPIGDVMYNDTERKARAYDLLQSFESLYALKLEKGHFVCEVEKPARYGIQEYVYKPELEAYEAAQAKVIFEGFEKYEKNAVTKSNLAIWFSDKGAWMECNLMSSMDGSLDTIGDLLHSIARYNRTAATPIELKYTSNILSLLKIEG